MSEFTVVGLRVVREAARHGSFSIAAERLGYTQSAVSRQIALMEQAAGQTLFERHARGVQPTEAGRVVVRHAEAVLGELHAARQDLQDLGPRPPGRLRVGAFSTATAALVPRAIAALVRQEPQTQVPLREGVSPGLLTSVARGRLDLAVVTPLGQLPEGVEVTPILDDPLLVAIAPGHPFTGRVTTSCAIADRPGPIMETAVRNDHDCDVKMGPHGLVPSYLYRYREPAAGQADRRAGRPVGRPTAVPAA